MRREAFWVLIVVALLGCAAIILSIRLSFSGHEILREITKSIGEALVIAAIIGATVDQYVKRNLLWETSHDISKYLIGYSLPKEIQDTIHTLMCTTIVRRDFEQHYVLERESHTKLKITISGKYKVVNCTNSEKVFTPRLDFEKHENPTVVEFRCDSADPRAVDRKQGNVELSEKDEGVLSLALKKIRLQPETKGITYTVWFKYWRLVDAADSDILSFAAPIIGVTITAETPPDLTFDIGKASINTENRWEFHQLFWEGQHIHVRWFECASQHQQKESAQLQ